MRTLTPRLGRACEIAFSRIGQSVSSHGRLRLVDFVPGAIDKRHVDVFSRFSPGAQSGLMPIVLVILACAGKEPNEAAAPIWAFKGSRKRVSG